MSDDTPHYVCDQCGYQSSDLNAVRAHLADTHNITNPAIVGRIEQRAGILTLESGGETTVIDLAAWLRGLLDEGVSE